MSSKQDTFHRMQLIPSSVSFPEFVQTIAPAANTMAITSVTSVDPMAAYQSQQEEHERVYQALLKYDSNVPDFPTPEN